MNRATLLATAFVFAASPALAAQSMGSGALALAAIVGAQSPGLSASEKSVLAHFLAGETNFTPPPGVGQIVVKADKIMCRLGDVAIVVHSCTLTFGQTTLTRAGSDGQALLATLMENGVQGDGAMGTIYYSVMPLSCTIDVAEVLQNAGGGARCTFTSGP